MGKEPRVQRKYRDTLFRLLYRDRQELLKLYNALNGTAYDNQEELEIYTLENAVYMNVKNDVSFLVQSELNLYEQQSTFNPNMPLRDLIYISRQFEKYIWDKSVYSSRLVRLPTPRFVVFYNGTELRPERQVLKLSDAFEKCSRELEPELELKVLMLNINTNYNKELLEKCETLRGYCRLVEGIRTHVKELPIEEAAERAVGECIREGILADFLRMQRAEVIAVSIFEYHEEEELKKIRAVEYEIGKEEGIEEGIEIGEKKLTRLLQALLRDGRGEEMLRAVQEEEYRLCLYKEYCI